MAEPTSMKVHYDEKFDLLEIFFQEPEPAVTIELMDDVYIHMVPDNKQVVSVTIITSVSTIPISPSRSRAC